MTMTMKKIYKVFTYSIFDMKRLFVAAVSVIFLLTGCYKDELRQMHEDLDSLKDVTIASLSQQAQKIESSISNLNDMNAELQVFVDALDKSRSSVEKTLAEATSIMNDFQGATEGEIDAAMKEFMIYISTLNASLETELSTVDAMIESLTSDGDDIQGRIDELKSYIESLYAEQSWVSGTFATLKVQNDIIAEIESIKAKINTLTASADELNDMLEAMILKSIDEFKTSFTDGMSYYSWKLTEQYEDAVKELQKTISQSSTEALAKAISESESSIMSWVNEKLKDYYTIAQAEAQIASFDLMLGNVKDGSSLQSQIASLNSDLDAAKSQIKEAYEKAIKDAIEEHEGKISAKIASEISEIRTGVLKTLEDRLSPIEKDVEELWTAVGTLEGTIKSAEDQRKAIDETLDILNTLKMTLEEYLKSVSSELSAKDLENFNALKALIDKLDKLVKGTDASSLPSQIAALQKFVGTVPEGTLTSWISDTFKTLNEQFSTISTIEEVDAIVKALNDVLIGEDGKSGQEKEISDLEKQLSSLITDSKSIIEKWIDDKLVGYYTAAAVEGKLEALEKEITSYYTDGDEKIQKLIDALEKKFGDQKASLESAYRKAITEAIETEKGVVTAKIQSDFAEEDEKISKLAEDVADLDAQVDTLREELNGYIEAAEELQKTIKELSAFLAAKNEKSEAYASLLALVEDMDAKFKSVTETYADLTKTEFETLYSYIKDTLSVEAAKVKGLVERLDKVEETLADIGKFMNGFDDTDGDLKTQLDTIRTAITELQKVVDGETGGNASLQSQIDAISVALYGTDKDPNNPSATSIQGMLELAIAKLTETHLSSITYIPKYLDHKEDLFVNGQSSVSATFHFLVKPAKLAKIVADSGCATMKFKNFSSSTLYDYSQQTFNASSDGILTVSVVETNNMSALITKDDNKWKVKESCSALYYEKKDEAGNILSSFTSQFIQFNTGSQVGTGDIPADNTYLYFTAEGGTKSVTVGEDGTYATEPYWIVRPGVREGSINLVVTKITYDELDKLAFGNLYPEEGWEDVVTISPTEDNIVTDYSKNPFRNYYKGKNTISFTVSPNTSTQSRRYSFVLRIIDEDETATNLFSGGDILEEDLVIRIEQEGAEITE